MSKPIQSVIQAKGMEIALLSSPNQADYISLTDIARYRNTSAPKDVVKNWMRTRSTIEFLGLWETLNNPDFKGVEFDAFKTEPAKMRLRFPLSNGFPPQMRSASSQNQAGMEAVPSRTRISPLNLPHGFHPSSSSISSKTTSGSNPTTATGMRWSGQPDAH